ncbi:tetratricopeptide repeat protein [Candidatus Peregrinibacteria bacterium]|nr:tetratricopeptide repeat protein [Candidatus Peregrinibacteria bacterium]
MLGNQKGFKILVVALSVSWLGVLAVNLSPKDIAQTNVFDADGNLVETEFLLDAEDKAHVAKNLEEWNEEDMRVRARSLAENGAVAFNYGDFENAIDLYNQALELGTLSEENTLTLLSNLAIAYEAYNDPMSAVKTYEVLKSKLSEDNALFHVATGAIALLQEYADVPKAIKELEIALQFLPSDFDANNTLALIYMGEYGSEFEDFARALKYNKKTLSISPDNINVKINLSMNYIELGKHEEAIKHLGEVLKAMPNSMPANYLIMKAKYANEEIFEARKYAEKLVEMYDGFQNDKLVAEILESY